MLSNGIDLIEIERVKRSLQSEHFLERVFGARERAEFEAKGNRAESIAGAFAAKEAFSKALGTGIRGFLLSEVEVLHDELGRPYFALSGSAEKIAEARGMSFALSITHTEQYAAAFVTAWTEKEVEE